MAGSVSPKVPVSVNLPQKPPGLSVSSKQFVRKMNGKGLDMPKIMRTEKIQEEDTTFSVSWISRDD